jgi:hypothetical protein
VMRAVERRLFLGRSTSKIRDHSSPSAGQHISPNCIIMAIAFNQEDALSNPSFSLAFTLDGVLLLVVSEELLVWTIS